MMFRTDALFRKVKAEYAHKLGVDVHVLMGCYSDWNGDVKYVVTVVNAGQDVVVKWGSWSPRAALKKALQDLPKVSGGSSPLSIVKSDFATSGASEKN